MKKKYTETELNEFYNWIHESITTEEVNQHRLKELSSLVSGDEFIENRDFKSDLKSFLELAPKIYLPSTMIYTVIFSFQNDRLKVLLLNFDNTGYFSLPGGYVMKNETLDDASLRILRRRSDMEEIYLEQFYTAGNVSDSYEDAFVDKIKKIDENLPKDNWLSQRKIAVCYYSLIDESKVILKAKDILISDLIWADVQKLPMLMQEHELIINKAIKRLQSDMDEKLAAYNLLEEFFTMGELQKLYEVVFQKKFARNNFQRKMLSLDILERHEKQYTGKAHKAPYLYSLKKTQ